MSQRGVLITLTAVMLLSSGAACTMTLNVAVQDDGGNPVQNAVVFANPVQGDVPQELPSGGGRNAGISVVNQRIVPLVLPVRIGSSVSFRNRDAIQHHIYSISPAKKFELTIDRDSCSSDIEFDRPGLVVMGSASNDRMIGFVYVLRTPWFARTGADGRVDLRGLPRGSYDVRVWHPAMKRSPEATTVRVDPSSGGATHLKFALTLPSVRDPEPAPPSPFQPAAGGR